MLKELLKNPRALIYAVLVHAVLLVVLVVTIQWNSKPAALQGSGEIVQAVVIDESELKAKKEQKLQEEQRKREEEQIKRKAEEERRQAEQQKQRAEEQRKREAREAVQKKKQQEAEQQRQAKLKAEQETKERKRVEEQKRLAEQEVKRKLEAKRKAEEQRKADEARRQRENLEMMQQQMAQEEADRAAQAAAEQRQRELASMRDQYRIAIAQKVERNWIKPPSISQGASCKVRVKQIPGGDVVSVDASACTGDPSYRKSVEAAVFRAAPLPQPPDSALFDQNIIFTFEPEQ